MHYEVETVPQHLTGLADGIQVPAGKAQLVGALFGILLIFPNTQARLNFLLHPNQLRVLRVGGYAAQELLHLGVGVDAVRGFDAAEHAFAVEDRETFLHHFFREEAVEQHLISHRHVGPRTCNNTVKPDVQNVPANNGEVSAGTQESQMSLGPHLPDCLPDLGRGGGQCGYQSAVNVQEYQLSVHTITPFSFPRFSSRGSSLRQSPSPEPVRRRGL